MATGTPAHRGGRRRTPGRAEGLRAREGHRRAGEAGSAAPRGRL